MCLLLGTKLAAILDGFYHERITSTENFDLGSTKSVQNRLTKPPDRHQTILF